jgi:hypothetical protein
MRRLDPADTAAKVAEVMDRDEDAAEFLQFRIFDRRKHRKRGAEGRSDGLPGDGQEKLPLFGRVHARLGSRAILWLTGCRESW